MRHTTPARNTSRMAALAAALLVATACTHEKPMAPELQGLYDRIHEDWQEYEAGLELVLAGDDVAGKNRLAAATTRLVVAARACSETPGCDVDVFVHAMGRLVAERRFAEAQAALESDLLAGDPDPDFGEIEAVPDEPAMPLGGDSLLTGAELAELIPLNRRVKAALNDWLTWNRPGLVKGHENYQHLRSLVAPIYEEAGLPEALLFGIMVKESGVKAHAYSRAGAAGLLQFMPRTARRYGLGSINGFDARLDAVASTRANARYLRDLLRRFDGNLELALAAYNFGETRLYRIYRTHKGLGFWDPRIYYALPWETRNYVPKVLAAAWLYLHPEEYGLELPRVETAVTSIVLEEPASLGELAICLGQESHRPGWFRTLRNLNPGVSPADRAPTGTRLELPANLVPGYAERCVREAPLLAKARELHDAQYPEKPEVMQYTVQRGDTLASIAARHRSTVRELAEMNGIEPPEYIVLIGQRLTVPARG